MSRRGRDVRARRYRTKHRNYTRDAIYLCLPAVVGITLPIIIYFTLCSRHGPGYGNYSGFCGIVGIVPRFSKVFGEIVAEDAAGSTLQVWSGEGNNRGASGANFEVFYGAYMKIMECYQLITASLPGARNFVITNVTEFISTSSIRIENGSRAQSGI